MLIQTLFLVMCLFSDSKETNIMHLVADFYSNQQNVIGEVHVFSCHKTGLPPEFNEHLLAISNKFRLKTYFGNDTNFVDNLRSDTHRLGVFVDLNCSEGYSIINKSSTTFLFNQTYVWLLWSDNYTQALNLLNSTTISLNSNVTLASSGVLMHDLYKLHRRLDLRSNLIGNWSENQGIMNIGKMSKKNDLEGIEITGALVLITNLSTLNQSELPKILLNDLIEPEKDEMTRFSLAFLVALEPLFNFTIKYIITNTWGYPLPNGTYNGMMGEIIRGNADLGLTLADFRHERLVFACYFNVVRDWTVSFLFRQPTRFGSMSALISPLHKNVWYGLFALSAVFTTLYHIVLKWESRFKGQSWYSTFTLVVGLVAQQGIQEESLTTPGRIWTLVVVLFTFMVYTFYNAEVLNGLLSPISSKIQTIDELIDSPLMLAAWDVPYTRERLSRPDEVTQSLIHRVNKQKEGLVFYSKPDSIKLIQSGKYAVYLGDETFYGDIFKVFTSNQLCSLSSVSKEAKYPVALFGERHTAYRELFAHMLLIMHERGIIKREVKRWWLGKPKCNWQQETMSVSIESLVVAYGTMCCGITFSVIVLIIEVLLNFFKTKC